MSQLDSVFDEEHAARYDRQFEALAAVKDALHLCLDIALQELEEAARILVVGAGTGQELLALAAEHPNWHFVAVDPSAPMLEGCRRKAKEMGVLERCTLHIGTLETLPLQDPFHAATSILVSHFMTDREVRRSFFTALKDRLLDSGVLITADLTAEETSEEQTNQLALWRRTLERAMDSERANQILEAYGRDVILSTSSEMQQLLREAGLKAPHSVYQFGLIRAWLARR